MAGIGWAPLGGEWWTWRWCVAAAMRWRQWAPAEGAGGVPQHGGRLAGQPVAAAHRVALFAGQVNISTW